MTADRKAALMEYAQALQAEIEAFAEAMFGMPSSTPSTADIYGDTHLALLRLEIAARLYGQSGAMLTVTRWERMKQDQAQAQRAALKAEVPPPPEGGVTVASFAEGVQRPTPAQRSEQAQAKDEAFMTAWVKLVDDSAQRKLSEETFRALIADGIVKRAAPEGGLADKLKAIYSERVKETLLSKAKEAGWRP